MGDSVVVSIEDIRKDNPRLCLSALRYTGSCFKCPQFDTCDSRIVSQKAIDFQEKNKKITELKSEIKRLQDELKEVE
jgi:hypothetical protein